MNIAYNADCMAALRDFPDQYFDLAVVDPPYGIKINHNMGRRKGNRPSDYKRVEWDDAPPPAEYFRELQRVSKNQIIWGANHFVSLIPSPDSHCWLCWDKGFSDEVSFASFELAWTSFNQPCKRLALSSAQSGRIHPTQKPVALYAWIFAKFAKAGDKILDTHLGSGSSRIAAWDAGLDFVGYEIDREYFDAQEQRFTDHTAQLSIFGGGGAPDFCNFIFCQWCPQADGGREGNGMEITAKMTAEEFLDFMAWKKDHAHHKAEVEAVRNKLEYFAKKTCWAIEEDPKRPGKVKIVDQDHAAELLEQARDLLE